MTDEPTLGCGHPVQCLDEDDECEWCEQVGTMSKTINTLTRILEDQAIVVQPGAILTLACETVGYLAQYGGTIHQHSSLASVLSEQQETPQ